VKEPSTAGREWPSSEPTCTEPSAHPPPDNAGLLGRLAPTQYAVPLLLAVGGLLFILNLGGYPLYTKGEPREAVTVLDIVRGGGMVLPMRAGVEVPSKPLLMHWLAAVISLAGGKVNEWTVRSPSAICSILGIIACYLYVSKLFDARSGLSAALILATTCQYLQAGTGARVDMTLTLFLEVALFEFIMIAEGLRKQPAPLYLAIAWAVLTKGPVGAVLPALVAAVWIAIRKRTDVIRKLRLGVGTLLIGAIAGGWYIAAIAVGGMAFVHKQLLAENLYRLLGSGNFHQGHAHPFYYMEGALIAGFMPWSPLAAVALFRCFTWPRKHDARLSFLLVWLVTVLVFYNLPQSKRGVYLLALYPALSSIIGIVVSNGISSPTNAIERPLQILCRILGACFIAAGGCAIIGCAMLYLRPATMQWILAQFGILVTGLPLALTDAVSKNWFATVMITCGAIAAGGYLVRLPRPAIEGPPPQLPSLAGKLLAGTVAGTIAIALSINLVIEPAIARTLSPKQFSRQADNLAESLPLYWFGSLDYAFVFYSGRDVKLVGRRDKPALMVGREEEWRLLPPDLRTGYKVVLTSNPTDLDNSGRLILLKRHDALSQ
jgi:4-amino-4-deoxy-L-arabinose transferase-like glycosyltransferase